MSPDRGPARAVGEHGGPSSGRRPTSLPAEGRSRNRVLMIGPLPPPNGGVANFVCNMRDMLPAAGFEVEVFRTGGSGTTGAMTQPARDLGAMVRFLGRGGGRPDIVHVHTSSYYSFLRNVPYVLWARHLSRSKVVLHVHGGMFLEFYDRASSALRYVIRSIFARADAIIVTSPSWIAPIARIAPGSKVVSLSNGFDAATFRPGDRLSAREELDLPPEGRVVVTVGYLETVKGHAYLIDAMATVAEQAPDVRLYILGDGSLRTKLKDQVTALGLEGRVRFVHEPLPSSGIARWMTAADLFVLPSLGEGNPTVMFECLGCGRPFVGTTVGGIPDVISSDRLGLLCPPGNAAALAGTLTEAMEREWDAEAISAHAQRYSWTTLADQLASEYRGL